MIVLEKTTVFTLTVSTLIALMNITMIIMNAMRIHLFCEERLCLGQNIITKIYYDIKHTKHV